MTSIFDPEIDMLIDGPKPFVAMSDPEIVELIDGPQASEKIMGGYDAASRVDRDLALWAPPLRSADRDLLPGKDAIDSRIRDAHRNDGYISAGVNLKRDHIVGSMFVLNARPNVRVLGLDEKWAEEFQTEVEEKFTLYAESDRNFIDASEVNNFTSLVRMAVGIDAVAGEVLATAEWKESFDRPFSTCIQMVDVDRLSNPDGEMDNHYLRKGVKKDKFGVPIGYHIRMYHPTDYTVQDNTYQWKYVSARRRWGRRNVIHLFEQERPDQSRGVAGMVAALKEIHITKRFRDITLQNAVTNATFAASIESDMPSEAVFSALGGGNDVGGAISKYATSYLGEIGKYVGGSKNLMLDGVKIPHLFPGTKLQLHPAGTPGGVGTEFEKSLIRYIAAILGVSYEQLSRDYSETSYAGFRAGANEAWKAMQARKALIADRFATMIYRLWLEEAINRGQIDSLPRNAPSFYEGLNGEAYCSCTWIGASRGQIDELKETQAAVLRMKMGLSTQEDELARLGKDWRKVNQQRQREQADQKARGLFIEEDNSMNAASGTPRQRKGQENGEDD